jgi:hypothetical protein
MAVCCATFWLRIDPRDRVHAAWPRPDVEYGHRFCRAFETYLQLHQRPILNFEWAWNLLHAISRNDELLIARCEGCRTPYVQDAYALDRKTCPSCEISSARLSRKSN